MRIIGGKFRGRTLRYSGDERTRPMKDRVREAVFNLLADSVRGSRAIDLFAGTGALGIEALSRGASRATLIERHFPTVELIRQNVRALGLEDQVEILEGDAFYWSRRLSDSAGEPWTVFVSPPYELYVAARDEMIDLIGQLVEAAPAGSNIVVESDARLPPGELPDAPSWDVRNYPPAVVAIYRKAP